jgi:hypothetical protein
MPRRPSSTEHLLRLKDIEFSSTLSINVLLYSVKRDGVINIDFGPGDVRSVAAVALQARGYVIAGKVTALPEASTFGIKVVG